MQARLAKTRGWAWRLAVAAVGLAVTGQLAVAGAVPAAHATVATGHWAGTIKPAKTNLLDCNGWSRKYIFAAPAMRMRCTDPVRVYDGRATRFYDNGHYVGHDEPDIKFISSRAGSGNTMTYGMRLPKDPRKAPAASGSRTDYAELSVAPWFGLPLCDPRSFPQNPCKPDSDANTGMGGRSDAGSAFMELQFYAPGFTPLVDGVSCSKTRWCAALTIDSLECTLNFACNSNCVEPKNFSYVQANGVPPGPPAPQDPSAGTFFGDAHTLRMRPGDVLKVSISDPASGFLVKIRDVTSHQRGYMQASASNGFANTSISDCAGHPHTWHAEYSTAKKQNQVPWTVLETGVLMQQEIGHFESCASLAHKDGHSTTFAGGGSYSDPNVYQTCVGGREGKGATGEGGCGPSTGVCAHPETQGVNGPVACPSNTFTSGQLCEFADGFCAPKGGRPVTLNGNPAKEHFNVSGCLQNQFQNGDLDFDGNSYRADWPDGTRRYPQTFRYVGPFSHGHTYPSIQFQTNVGASERLCNPGTGARCTAPPIGARFYPFWSLNRTQRLKGISQRDACVWNFGNVIKGVTATAFGKDKQYGKPDLARFGGTLTSRVRPNPATRNSCRKGHL